METFEKKLKRAVRVLKKGGVVIYPTDTVYGMGVDALNIDGINKLLKAKERRGKPFLVMVTDKKMAKRYVKFTRISEILWDKFMPGAITFLLPLRKGVPEPIKLLSAGTGNLGIRIPNNNTCRELAARLNKPIVTTSANKSGETPAQSIEECRKQFQGNGNCPDYYLDEGFKETTVPSTLITVVKNQIEIIREGLIPKEIILNAGE